MKAKLTWEKIHGNVFCTSCTSNWPWMQEFYLEWRHNGFQMWLIPRSAFTGKLYYSLSFLHQCPPRMISNNQPKCVLAPSGIFPGYSVSSDSSDANQDMIWAQQMIPFREGTVTTPLQRCNRLKRPTPGCHIFDHENRTEYSEGNSNLCITCWKTLTLFLVELNNVNVLILLFEV